MSEMIRVFQWLSVGVFVMTLAAVAVGWQRWPAYRGAYLPALLFAVFGTVYYLLVLGGRLAGQEMLLWGAVHRFLGAMVIFGAVVALSWALGGKRE